jgi:predicted metal-dependent hydrolase
MQLALPLLPAESSAPADPVLVYVRHAKARRYVLRLIDADTVRVTVPRWGSRRGAAEFAAQERRWIERQRRRAREDRLRADSVAPERDDPRLRARAGRELPPRLLQLAAAHGLAVTRVSIRNQKSRWGSCARNGHICLNWRLVTMPPWVRDYVMIHELMHLKRMDHSPRFWRLVAKACPEYQAARAWLRANRA